MNYYNELIKKEWTYSKGVVVVSFLAIMLAVFAAPWGVSGAFTKWGTMLLHGVPAKYRFFADQTTLTNSTIVFGAAISCLLAAQWKLRMLKSVRQFFAGALGGLCMGIGARISPGCNIGNLFSGLPSFALSGWIFLVCVFLGSWAGGKLLTRCFMSPTSHKRHEPRKALGPAQQRARKAAQVIIGCVLLVAWIVIGFVGNAAKVPVFLFIGLAIGYAMQHSRVCFTAACRDPWLGGSTKMTKAFIVALALCSIGFAGIHISKYGADLHGLTPGMYPAAVMPIGLHLVIGAFIFGIGAVLAGGCAAGTLIRSGEGVVQSWIALVFFIVGSVFGVPLYRWIQHISNVEHLPWLYSGAKVYLPQVFGGIIPTLVMQLVVLGALWILADWWERRRTADFAKK
jgi:uncharacterized membrane protein YedE/YeeE